MNTWEYKVTNHIVEELEKCVETPKPGKVISCDASGGCMVNDVCKVGTESLAKTLNQLGKEGWELIMTTYHHGELLCIWKKQK